MAGIENKIVFGEGFKLQTSSADSISRMQETSTDVSQINHTGNPEGVISANPSSLCHDPISGDIYLKQTGTGNTGWILISTSAGIPGSQIAFYSYLSATLTNATGDGTVVDPVPYNTATVNSGNGFNPSTGIFTVPVGGAGNYAFSALMYFTNLSSGHTAAAGSFIVNGVTFKSWDLNPFAVSEGSDLSQTGFSGVMALSDGDTVEISIDVGNSTKTVGIGGTLGVSYFSGFLINSNVSGDVVGPSSSTDNDFSAFDGTTGKLIKDSGFNSSSFLQTSNNLSDVSSQSTALNNLMPPTPSKGTIAVFNGTNWVNLPIGTDTYVLTADSGATNGLDWEAPSGGGFGSPTYFQAYLSTTTTVNANTTNQVVFDLTTANVGSAYNASTGIFTAPETGFYGFSAELFLILSGAITKVNNGYTATAQTAIQNLFGSEAYGVTGEFISSYSWQMPMTAGDTVYIKSEGDGTGTYQLYGSVSINQYQCMFSGYRIA